MGFSESMKKASLVGAFFVSVLWFSPAMAFCPSPGKLPQLPVQKVVDGDTVRLVDGRSIRLIGLNAPELGRKGRSDEPFAEAARKRLAQLVAANDGRVGLRPGRQAKDRYGRTLAHAYDAGGRNIEAVLLAEGLGFAVAVEPNVALAECQRAAERGAREARRGLWRRAPWLEAAALEQSGFALIRGRVAKVERNRGGIWLEMEGPLVLRVEPRMIASFDEKVLMALAGRDVEVRGWVMDRSRSGEARSGQARWLLPLTSPAMLEVVR